MTTKTIDVHDAQTQLIQLLEQALQGGDIVITDGNIPLVRLVPVNPLPQRRVANLHKGAMQMHNDFNEPLPDAFWLGES